MKADLIEVGNLLSHCTAAIFANIRDIRQADNYHQKCCCASKRRKTQTWRPAEREKILRAHCMTPPTTRAGVLRLLRHLADFLDEDDVVNDLYVGDIVGDAIRNAVAMLEREALS